MPTKTKAKKPAKSTKPKTAKKAKPKKLSAPMKAALDAVAAMPVRKESKLEAIIQLLSRPEGRDNRRYGCRHRMAKTYDPQRTCPHALAKKRGYQIVSDKPKGRAADL
jgi:hypothetical protein